ncbi:MAG: aspartate aminotransferase family protein, partial [Pseudomonadota bacterium]
PGEKPGTLGALAATAFAQNGVISRNLGDSMAFSPPLIMTKSDADFVLEAVSKSLDEVAAQVL